MNNKSSPCACDRRCSSDRLSAALGPKIQHSGGKWKKRRAKKKKTHTMTTRARVCSTDELGDEEASFVGGRRLFRRRNAARPRNSMNVPLSTIFARHVDRDDQSWLASEGDDNLRPKKYIHFSLNSCVCARICPYFLSSTL